MASSSKVVRSAPKVTLGQYFSDNNISENHQQQVVNKIKKMQDALNTESLQSANCCIDNFKSKNYSYSRKSAIHTEFPLLKSPRRTFIPLKFELSEPSFLIFKKCMFKSEQIDGNKKSYPALVLDPSLDPLNMSIVKWNRVKIKQDEQSSRCAREMTHHKNCQGVLTTFLFDTCAFKGKGGDLRLGTLTEWCPSTLAEKLSDKNNPLSINIKYKYAKSLIDILGMLREKNLYMSKLNSVDLQIDAKCHLKLANFQKVQTIEQESKNDQGSNSVFDAGVILYELFYGKPPFSQEEINLIALDKTFSGSMLEMSTISKDEIIQIKINNLFKDSPASETLRGVLKGMLQKDPKKQLSLDTIATNLTRIRQKNPSDTILFANLSREDLDSNYSGLNHLLNSE